MGQTASNRETLRYRRARNTEIVVEELPDATERVPPVKRKKFVHPYWRATLRRGRWSMKIAFAGLLLLKLTTVATAKDGIAWDVVRPNHPLFGVVAEGAEGKARTISLFLVRRSGANERYLTKEAPKSAK